MRIMAFTSYVALGDSFTEGVGDPDPARPNGLRGWADRVADALAAQAPTFRYANLAVRGRKLPQIIAEQVPAAVALDAALVSIHGGGNDVLRPSVDIDALAASYDDAVGRLAANGAQLVMFTLPDTRSNQAFKMVRGRCALFNEFIREIADRHGAVVVDIWRDHDYDRHHFLDKDRLHYSPAGHQMMAMRVLDALGVAHELSAYPIAARPPLTARERRAEHVEWTRSFLVPWIGRRLTGRSSGDGISPKYADLTPLR
jgi:lysophospholipase L1-like esterase